MKSKLYDSTDEITQRYRDGVTADQLAQEYGVAASTMRYFLKTICGITMRPPQRGSTPQLPQDVEETIVRAYQAGETITLIASRHAIGYGHVQSILRRHHARTGRRLRPPFLHIPTSEAQLGYIAALVDGEGTIYFGENDRRRRAFVRIVNTDRALIEWLAQFGGVIDWEDRSARQWKTLGRWTVAQAIDVYHLLIAIEPYLIVKRVRAQEAIRFVRTCWHFA